MKSYNKNPEALARAAPRDTDGWHGAAFRK